ncbi:MAG: hypothetical protein JRJ00_00305 [Deltaproteobacteria bacterium]|nr:hypothetical protein [Deltaproteobacteria bacterium]
METNKTLIDLMVEAYREDITKEFVREDKEDDYLNQKDFDTCESRMMKANMNAIERSNKIGALGSVLHRNSSSHGDNRGIEEAELTKQLGSETVEAVKLTPEVKGSDSSFWMI